MRIAFIHPDLGIGGAERLIVDMAKCAKKSNKVTIYTSHYDKNRSFEETKGNLSLVYCIVRIGYKSKR